MSVTMKGTASKLPTALAIFLLSLGGGPAESQELVAEWTFGSGYPDFLQFGGGLAVWDRLSIRADLFFHHVPQEDHGGGLSARLAIAGVIVDVEGHRLVTEAGAGRSLIHIRECWETNPGQCTLSDGWIGQFGIGYGHRWDLEVRALLMAQAIWWDKDESYDAANDAFGWAPSLFTVTPGLSIQLRW